MKKHLFYITLNILFINALSQEEIKINNNYNQHKLKPFLDSISSVHDATIFYKKNWLDSIYVKQEKVPSNLKTVLDNSIKKTALSYIKTDENILIFTYNYKIKKELPDFKISKDLSRKKTVVFDEDVDRNTGRQSNTTDLRVIRIGKPGTNIKSANITGYIKSAETGEPIIAAEIYINNLNIGTVTDLSGYYVLALPMGRHSVTFRSMGRKEEKRQIIVYSDGNFNLEMKEKVMKLKGVVVKADQNKNVSGMQMGMNKIDMRTIRNIPMAMGEADVLKAALLLPGIQSVGEAASGVNVRGGSTDQNLVLINDAPVFNTSHFFGFFSVFNPDVIRDFEIYKSTIPAEFGGRISSVLDIQTKIGNRKKFSGAGGISPVTGRFMIEGPIIKNKSSFVAAGRTTYSDWILKRIQDPAIRNSKASFSDFHIKADYDINENNAINYSFYYSRDNFKFNADTNYNYSNLNTSLKYKHIFNKKLVSYYSAIWSRYNYQIIGEENGINGFVLKHNIDYEEIKAKFLYFPVYNHKITAGINSVFYQINPGTIDPSGSKSLAIKRQIDMERANESAVFISDEVRFGVRLSLYGGIRYSFFAMYGPYNYNTYLPDQPINLENQVGTDIYGNEIVNHYHGPEYRFSLRYRFGRNNAVKLSYNRMRQYLHMISNTTSISPTDTWKLSDPYIKPQISDQVALGLYKNNKRGTIETSAEIYYKKIKDIIEYKSGAVLVMNSHLETDLINGNGKAYGLELLLKKTSGKLNGWIAYTYSRILIQVNGLFQDEKINEGLYFPANHDKPHDFTTVINYKFNRRLNLSNNITYSTGRPITYPVAKYNYRNYTLLHYSNRNEYRVPDYFRWDISINIEGNLKSKKIAHSSWSLGVYNVTGRKNVYSIFFVSREGFVKGYKMSVFARPIFTVSYNIKF